MAKVSERRGVAAKKPVGTLFKPVKPKFAGLFKSMAKALVDGTAGKWDSLAKDIIDAGDSIGLSTEPGELVWLLVERSIQRALLSLTGDVRHILTIPPETADNLLNFKIADDHQVVVTPQFFEQPDDLPVVRHVQDLYASWLQLFEMSEAAARAIARRLPSYFVASVADEWTRNHDKYERLRDAVQHPFVRAEARELGWYRYRAILRKQVYEGILGEPFSLAQLYVPLRAWCRDESETDGEQPPAPWKSKERRLVVDLEAELMAWIDRGDPVDALRMLSGGPGSGKSSFAKMLAAKLATQHYNVLFIPLHLFEPKGDLVDAIGKFVREARLLTHNPLDPSEGDKKTIVIFDGLDELAMQGRVAAEVARDFVEEVDRKASRLNQKEDVRLLALLIGREIVVQACERQLRKPRQVLHLLPYKVAEDASGLDDPQSLAKRDDRNAWWMQYGKVTGRALRGLPRELSRADLSELTADPLLNFLVAIAWERDPGKLARVTSRNEVYAELLKAVHSRGWEARPHPAVRHLSLNDFHRILEEIATAAWHGHGRTTTLGEIEYRCSNGYLRRLLETYEAGAKEGLTRLLTAFYFRKQGSRPSGEEAFEFTHKSFGEYLTSSRIVRLVQAMHEERLRYIDDPDRGWSERRALLEWVRTCGPTALDEDLFAFIRAEVALRPRDNVGRWHTTLCSLVSELHARGLPLEELGSRPAFREEARLARNAGEALLALLSICSDVLRIVAEPRWPTSTAFGEWLREVQGQRSGPKNRLVMRCLGSLELSGSRLEMSDLYDARLSASVMKGACLVSATLWRADLRDCDMSRSEAHLASFEECDLTGANLTEARLQHASFTDAAATSAVFHKAELARTIFVRADLSGADLSDADLSFADLRSADLTGASLAGAQLDRATYDSNTKWPTGFDAGAAGAVRAQVEASQELVDPVLIGRRHVRRRRT